MKEELIEIYEELPIKQTIISAIVFNVVIMVLAIITL